MIMPWNLDEIVRSWIRLQVARVAGICPGDQAEKEIPKMFLSNGDIII
jgi:hypothetical protein